MAYRLIDGYSWSCGAGTFSSSSVHLTADQRTKLSVFQQGYLTAKSLSEWWVGLVVRNHFFGPFTQIHCSSTGRVDYRWTAIFSLNSWTLYCVATTCAAGISTVLRHSIHAHQTLAMASALQPLSLPNHCIPFVWFGYCCFQWSSSISTSVAVQFNAGDVHDEHWSSGSCVTGDCVRRLVCLTKHLQIRVLQLLIESLRQFQLTTDHSWNGLHRAAFVPVEDVVRSALPALTAFTELAWKLECALHEVSAITGSFD